MCTALTKARADVGKVSLLPEELAKELYCIALSEDKDLAKQLTDLDLNGTTLTLANLQVRLQICKPTLTAGRHQLSKRCMVVPEHKPFLRHQHLPTQ